MWVPTKFGPKRWGMWSGTSVSGKLSVTPTFQAEAWNEIPHSRGSHALKEESLGMVSMHISISDLRESESTGLRAPKSARSPSDAGTETLISLGALCLWIPYYILSACFPFCKMGLFRESKRKKDTKAHRNTSNCAAQTTRVNNHLIGDFSPFCTLSI